MATDERAVRGRIGDLAASWRSERSERLGRTRLDRADFAALAATGYLSLIVPKVSGGSWQSAGTSLRPICDTLRTLAAADPSPALVAAMHPAVLAFWVANPRPDAEAWEAQRSAACATALEGAEWGTVTSEPGSGGDVAQTRTIAAPADEAEVDAPIPGRRYRLTGDKHFGSGTGICAFMLTTAVPDGEDEPAAYFLDTRGLLDDGSVPGFRVTREWDGVGMKATQSHAIRLEHCPAVRFAWPDDLRSLLAGAAPINAAVFTAVILGVVDEAVAEAARRLGSNADSLRPYEQTEWVQAVTEHWLMQQALHGVLRAIENGAEDVVAQALRGKTAAAELAERILLRITRVVGGGTFSRSSPFSSWFEDVRALGFLRPPWGLAHDTLWAMSLKR